MACALLSASCFALSSACCAMDCALLSASCFALSCIDCAFLSASCFALSCIDCAFLSASCFALSSASRLLLSSASLSSTLDFILNFLFCDGKPSVLLCVSCFTWLASLTSLDGEISGFNPAIFSLLWCLSVLISVEIIFLLYIAYSSQTGTSPSGIFLWPPLLIC